VSVLSKVTFNVARQIPNRSTQSNEGRPDAAVTPRAERGDLQTQSGGRFGFGQWFRRGRLTWDAAVVVEQHMDSISNFVGLLSFK
jgi:hypothetical protein